MCIKEYPEYDAFLKAKVKMAPVTGFTVEDAEINPALKKHNRLMVKWMVEGGRRACFAAFGLHKTVTQLEAVRVTLTKTGGRGLIICPLGVRQEFVRDAIRILKWPEPPKFIRRIEEAGDAGIYLTNYETVRDGKLDPRHFSVASLDEASVLRGFGGTKTFREFMRLFTGDGGPLGDRRGTAHVPYRFVATATPSPNDYIELLAYADFLSVMDVSQAKTRFFKRDSTQADKLTLHAHKEEEFWLWVASWALFVQKPSDITGDEADDEGYIMPELEVHWHELPSDHSTAGTDHNGQGLMFREHAIGITGASREKRDSLDARVAKMMELREENPSEHRIIWHDTEIERAAIKKAIPDIVTVQGKDTDDHKEKSILGFSDGAFPELAGKPCMLGSGTNFQRYCHWEIFLGIGFKFNDFIQSIHRVLRFGQEHKCRIDLIYTEAEGQVRRTLERKWQQHDKQVQIMVDINKKYGLSGVAMAQMLNRKMGVERIEVTGKNYRLVHNDNVKETKNMQSNSVGLILTSWPFSMQYEYSPNYADFGHCDNNAHFFQQMDFLTPEEYRILKPGRIYALHVKDRIVPGGMTGLGFQTVYPFHMDCIQHMVKHGFAFLGMKTIVTDVVRENKQTYRLGWSEQCLDGSRMGAGLPEYLLLFRKPVSDPTNGRADEPVVKNKPLQICEDGSTQPFNRDEQLPLLEGSGYSRSRWQIDAHGFARSSGDRLFTPEELTTLSHKEIFRIFRKHSLETIYNYEHHVRIGEELEGVGRMPTTFMILQPQSWHDDVWTDITRMRTMNMMQYSNGEEMHLCPMQFDIAKRVISQMSNPGDIVHDSFGGLFTVPYWAILLGRFGSGIELKPSYFTDGVNYCKAAEMGQEVPALFDLEEMLEAA
jgi:DNA modification methylase